MKARRFFLAMAAGSIGIAGFAAAKAADLSPPPPPPPPQVVVVDEDPSCFYTRVDGGAYMHERPTVTKSAGAPFGGGSNSASGESMTKSGFVEVGNGCQFTDNFRIEGTLGYRFKSTITDPFGSLNADLTTYTGFVNAFWDMATYNGFTPYVGAGAGFALHRLSGITAPVGPTSGSHLTFAWNIQAGIAYDVTDSLKLDVGYRFVNLGRAQSNGNPVLHVGDIKAHEFKVGLRYNWGTW